MAMITTTTAYKPSAKSNVKEQHPAGMRHLSTCGRDVKATSVLPRRLVIGNGGWYGLSCRRIMSAINAKWSGLMVTTSRILGCRGRSGDLSEKYGNRHRSWKA